MLKTGARACYKDWRPRMLQGLAAVHATTVNAVTFEDDSVGVKEAQLYDRMELGKSLHTLIS